MHSVLQGAPEAVQFTLSKPLLPKRPITRLRIILSFSVTVLLCGADLHTMQMQCGQHVTKQDVNLMRTKPFSKLRDPRFKFPVPKRSKTLWHKHISAAAAVEAPAASVTSTPLVADVLAPAAPPAPAAEPSSADQLFDWARCWYPVAALSSLKPDAPNALQLLGQRLVVWKDKQGAWRAFEDACPHRLVPLSEGRIHESGELQCTYHGWRFDSSGSCTNIPQIPDPKALSTACSSSRACAKAYPTQVLQDMLWVYSDSSIEGWQASRAAAAAAAGSTGPGHSSPAVPSSAADVLVERGWTLKSPWFQRDIPLSFDILLENMHDPSHVPQSHNGVIGDRNSDQRMTMAATGPLAKEGYTLTVMPPSVNGMASYRVEYKAPCLVQYNFPGEVTMLLYGLPTARGWSRVIMGFASPAPGGRGRPPTPQLPPLLNWFIDNVIEKSPALTHVFNRNPIMDGDSYFMHVGERELYARGDYTGWSRQYYMPATADVAVLAWRKWIDRFGAGLPVLPKDASDLPPLMPREQVFDRYNQHTKHCPHCLAALRNVTIAAAVAAAVAAVAAGSIVAAAVAGNVPLLSSFNAGAAAVALAAGLLVAGLLKLRQMFIYTDYVHADH